MNHKGVFETGISLNGGWDIIRSVQHATDYKEPEDHFVFWLTELSKFRNSAKTRMEWLIVSNGSEIGRVDICSDCILFYREYIVKCDNLANGFICSLVKRHNLWNELIGIPVQYPDTE